MDKKTKTAKIQTNIPEPLMERITARSEELWGENDSASNVVATALRDWLSHSKRGSFEARLDQMERRIEHLLTTRPADGFQVGRPSLADPQVRRRLGLKMPERSAPPLPKSPTTKQIESLGVQLVRAHRQRKVTFSYVPPEYLLGYDPAGTVDYSAYERVGFPLIRDPQSYSPENPSMKLIVESSCVQTSLINEPLLIYFFGRKLVVLDGLARFTAMLEVWRRGLRGMTRVPIELFTGEESEAKKERVLRNLHGGPRSLTREEFERAVDRSNGWV